ncbi:MAG: nucleoside recognition protein [Lachnospiraceae bacterium]|nr:nucleoside recognition protein [Lachnospiraceae bacterium]
MLNFLWGGMILTGIIYGALNGTMQQVNTAAIESAREAVTLCITMLGVMGLWLGMMEVARASGIMERLTKALQPFLHFLFPKIPKGHRCLEPISVNLISNLLGLGWAATPAGLSAMEELAALERERGREDYQEEGVATSQGNGKREKRKGRAASNEMCTFLVLNISSLQLIPVNVIAYRSQYGSAAPTAILAPGLVATALSTVVAVIFCKVMERRK